MKAAILKAREAARGLSEDAREPILGRLRQAEQRLEAEIPQVCSVPPKEEQL